MPVINPDSQFDDRYTPNYQFHLYIAGDPANLLDQYNATIRMIDTKFMQLQSALYTEQDTNKQLRAKIDELNERVYKLENPTDADAGGKAGEL